MIKPLLVEKMLEGALPWVGDQSEGTFLLRGVHYIPRQLSDNFVMDMNRLKILIAHHAVFLTSI